MEPMGRLLRRHRHIAFPRCLLLLLISTLLPGGTHASEPTESIPAGVGWLVIKLLPKAVDNNGGAIQVLEDAVLAPTEGRGTMSAVLRVLCTPEALGRQQLEGCLRVASDGYAALKGRFEEDNVVVQSNEEGVRWAIANEEIFLTLQPTNLLFFSDCVNKTVVDSKQHACHGGPAEEFDPDELSSYRVWHVLKGAGIWSTSPQELGMECHGHLSIYIPEELKLQEENDRFQGADAVFFKFIAGETDYAGKFFLPLWKRGGDRSLINARLWQELTLKRRPGPQFGVSTELPYDCNKQAGDFKVGAHAVAIAPIWRRVLSRHGRENRLDLKRKNVLIDLRPHNFFKWNTLKITALAGPNTHLFRVTCWSEMQKKAISRCLMKIAKRFLPAQSDVYVASSHAIRLRRFASLGHEVRSPLDKDINSYVLSWLSMASKFKYIQTAGREAVNIALYNSYWNMKGGYVVVKNVEASLVKDTVCLESVRVTFNRRCRPYETDAVLDAFGQSPITTTVTLLSNGDWQPTSRNRMKPWTYFHFKQINDDDCRSRDREKLITVTCGWKVWKTAKNPAIVRIALQLKTMQPPGEDTAH